jgi:predicted metalloprotease with PDZ domain
MKGAYRGMLEGLDPGNEYLPAAAYERAARGEDGGPADVGLSLSKQRGYIVVVAALAGSPAAEAGLSTGDVLISIDGSPPGFSGRGGARLLRSKPTESAQYQPGGGLRAQEFHSRRVLPPPAPVAASRGRRVLRLGALPKGTPAAPTR